MRLFDSDGRSPCSLLWHSSEPRLLDGWPIGRKNNLLLYCRQDLRLMAFSLFGVIVKLGVIADLLHH